MNYLFQKEFVPLIEAGTKQCTMQNTLRKGSKVGMPITLYKGSRFKPELIATKECLGIYEIQINMADSGTWGVMLCNHDKHVFTYFYTHLKQHKVILDTLARFDGFPDAQKMFDFHGNCKKHLFVWGEECNQFIKNLLQ